MIKKTPMLLCGAVLMLALALGGCAKRSPAGGGIGSTGPVTPLQTNQTAVKVTSNGFVPNNVTINVGDAIQFTDGNGGPIQTVCIGSNGTCAKSTTGPQQLQSGIKMTPFATKMVTFQNKGTYGITAQSHTGGSFDLTVTVN